MKRNPTREQIIQTTCDLLENQGFHGTGLNEIVRESGAPKGSIYYYFPGGKEEIAAEAVRMAGQRTAEMIHSVLSPSKNLPVSMRHFVERIAHHVEESGFRAGGPLTVVASETATTNKRINLACRDAYNRIIGAFAEQLNRAGWTAIHAAETARVITAAIEGGILLSRTFHSGDPLRQVAHHIEDMLSIQKEV